MKTRTLFHTIKLATGTWTLEVVHGEGTTHIYTPRHAARDAIPVDPWWCTPIAHDAAGTPLWEETRLMPVVTRR